MLAGIYTTGKLTYVTTQLMIYQGKSREEKGREGSGYACFEAHIYNRETDEISKRN
jgi:hypothetical protein